MKKEIKKSAIHFSVFFGISCFFVFSAAFPAPAENVGSELSEFNKIRRVQATMNLVHASPKPLLPARPAFSVAKLPAIRKLPDVSRLPAYPKFTAISAGSTRSGFFTGVSGALQKPTERLTVNSESAPKVQVLPALTIEKSAEPRNWFGLVFKTKDKKATQSL